MFETIVITSWFVIFYLAHKLYYENKIKAMKKKWDDR